jgi:hypothetical protein
MAKAKAKANTETVEQAVRRIATALPGVTAGVACKGTKLESTTYDVGGKSFAFVRRTEAGVEVRIKLGASQAAAKQAGHGVGAGGWTKLVLDGAAPAALAGWIAESHGALAPKPKR